MRGFSTLELILALMIMATTVTTVTLVTIGAPASLADGIQEREAVETASHLLTTELILGLHAFQEITPIATSTIGKYQISLSVTLLPDGLTKHLGSSIAWINTKGIHHSLTLYALLTDFVDASPTTPCNAVLEGDWTHPLETVFALKPGGLLPIISSVSAHPLTSLIVSNSILIAGVASSTSATDATLFLFDISSSSLPAYLGSIDNATSTRQGIDALAAEGHLIYDANAVHSNFNSCKQSSACSQLQIVDVHDPTAPKVIEDFQLPTTTPPYATGSGGQSIGKSIAYKNGFIYLGLSKTGSTAGEEFNVVDVHNPLSPLWLGGYSVGRTINRILLDGSYAYLATDDPTREFLVLDVHDPAHITSAGSYDAPGATDYGYGRDIDFASTTLMLGRTYTPNGPAISLLSTTTTTPSLLSSIPFSDLKDALDVNALLIRNYLAFTLTDVALNVFDISDTKHPSLYSSTPLPLVSTGSALSCTGNTLYVASVGTDRTGYLTILTGS